MCVYIYIYGNLLTYIFPQGLLNSLAMITSRHTHLKMLPYSVACLRNFECRNLHHRSTRVQNSGFHFLDPPRGLGYQNPNWHGIWNISPFAVEARKLECANPKKEGSLQQWIQLPVHADKTSFEQTSSKTFQLPFFNSKYHQVRTTRF